MRMIVKAYEKKNIDATIFRNVSQSFIFKGLTIAGNLLLIPLTIDILNKESFGVWVTISTILTSLTLFDLGISNGLRNCLVESLESGDNNLSKKYISTTYILISLISVVLIFVYAILTFFLDLQSVLFSNTIKENLNKVINIAFYLFIIRFILMTINAINFAKQKSGKNDLMHFICIVLTLIILYGLQYFYSLSLNNVVLIYCVVPIAVYLAYTVKFFVSNPAIYPSISHFDRNLVRNVMGISIAFLFCQFGFILVNSLPVFMIGKFYNTSLVTEFNISNKLYGIVFMGLSIVLTPYWSAFTTAKISKDDSWIRINLRKIQVFSFLGIIGIIIAFFLSTYIYKYWLGDSVDISFSMNLAAALFNTSLLLITPLNYYLNGCGLLKIQVYLALGNFILFAPLAYIMANYLGLRATGFVFTSTVLMIINYIITKFVIAKDI